MIIFKEKQYAKRDELMWKLRRALKRRVFVPTAKSNLGMTNKEATHLVATGSVKGLGAAGKEAAVHLKNNPGVAVGQAIATIAPTTVLGPAGLLPGVSRPLAMVTVPAAVKAQKSIQGAVKKVGSVINR